MSVLDGRQTQQLPDQLDRATTMLFHSTHEYNYKLCLRSCSSTLIFEGCIFHSHISQVQAASCPICPANVRWPTVVILSVTMQSTKLVHCTSLENYLLYSLGSCSHQLVCNILWCCYQQCMASTVSFSLVLITVRLLSFIIHRIIMKSIRNSRRQSSCLELCPRCPVMKLPRCTILDMFFERSRFLQFRMTACLQFTCLVWPLDTPYTCCI